MPAPTASPHTSHQRELSTPTTAESSDGKPGSAKTDLILSGPSGPPPDLPEASALSSKILDELTQRLLASIRYKTTWPIGLDRTEARRWLEPARFRARRALAPAEPDDITKALEALADTLQTGMPENHGQLMYIGL